MEQQQQKKSMFCFLYGSIFNWHKYITCKFSSGIYRVATKSWIISLPDFYKPHFTREKYPPPYVCHCFWQYICLWTAVFQGWSTGRVKFHLNSDEHLECSLRMATTAIGPAWRSCFTETRSHIPLVLWFCCSLFLYILITKKKN